MVSSTSLTISGSSAEVGSSNSMIFGFMQSERAIATRCCWPPESWPGYFVRLLRDLAPARDSAWPSPRPRVLGILRTQIGASVQFFQDRQMREEVEVLEHHADLAADLVDALEVVGEFDAVDDDLAGLVLLQAVDAADHASTCRSPTGRR